MGWKPMAIEHDLTVHAITPPRLTTSSSSARQRIVISASNVPEDAVVWLYWNGQPVLKASVLSVERSGAESVIEAELDLEGWELEADISLKTMVGSRDGMHGVWAPLPIVLKAA